MILYRRDAEPGLALPKVSFKHEGHYCHSRLTEETSFPIINHRFNLAMLGMGISKDNYNNNDISKCT